MILSGVYNVRDLSNRMSWINHLTIIRGERLPFVIFGHREWPVFELFRRIVGVVSLASKDASQNIVCFLDLSNDNSLEFATGGF